jgi:acetylornithine/succinyldiaminopimelate/putrescine aminotransferase
MVGLQLHTDCRAVANAAREKGLLIVPAGHNTVRLLPPLITTKDELEKSVSILDEVFASID